MDQSDLPFTIDGMVPDILFGRLALHAWYGVIPDPNSHGIPSRMTMGQLWGLCVYPNNGGVEHY